MGHAADIYKNSNKFYGYSASKLYKKENKIYGFFNDRFFFIKIDYKDLKKVREDIKKIEKLYGFGSEISSNDLLLKNTKEFEYKHKNIYIKSIHKNNKISILFMNKNINALKEKYTSNKYNEFLNIEGWNYVKWNMGINKIKKLLSDHDYDYKKWGWDYEPLQKEVIYNLKKSFTKVDLNYLRLRNHNKLKCYSVSDKKNFYFYNDKILGVIIKFNKNDKSLIFNKLKSNYPKGKFQFAEFRFIDNVKSKRKNKNLYNDFKYFTKKEKSFNYETRQSHIFTNHDSICFINKKVRKKILADIEKIKLNAKLEKRIYTKFLF